MPSARLLACELPSASLLREYRDRGAFTDCYCLEAAGRPSLADYVEALLTTPIFRVERALLHRFANRPSTDAEARALALGDTQAFAMWHVEGREANQLLIGAGRTRTWFMVAPAGGDGEEPAGARLYFGSAVLPRNPGRDGRRTFGVLFHALQGFHRLYSRALLRSAAARLGAGRPG